MIPHFARALFFRPKPEPVPTRGPRCVRCGCTFVEHAREVAPDFAVVGGECLSCDCDGFEGEP